MTPTVHVLGGGTFSHVRPHLALAAPAFGATARRIHEMIVGSRLTEDAQGEPPAFFKGARSNLWLTRMARGGDYSLPPVGDLGVTNDSVANEVETLIQDPGTKVIFFSVAMCDYTAEVVEPTSEEFFLPSGLDRPRLKTSDGLVNLMLTPAEKVIGRIRKERKDIFLIGFKTTTGATAQEQYEAGLNLLKKSSCNLVLANDLHTRLNMVVVPELGRYHETLHRYDALKGLVTMADHRYNLTFTRTLVQEGSLVPWGSSQIPSCLRKVVNHCVNRGAYKAFNNVTVGHFGAMQPGFDKDGIARMVSSRRKQNYNTVGGLDMVWVQSKEGEPLTAFGAKPSAGTTSQIAVLKGFYPKYDCIVHFHCPLKRSSQVPVRPQYAYECGSAECGQNTLEGMKDFGNLAAVMLDQHGPNIVFNSQARPEDVIAFIE